MSEREAIAIVGIGCRFPGKAHGPAAFWSMLRDGVDAVTDIPPDRFSLDTYYDPVPGRVGKSISRWGGFIDGIDRFDPAFFGLSPREADFMDPQQRLLLETAWEAVEDAGLILDQGRGTPAGVFVGISTMDYAYLQSSILGRSSIDIYTTTGQALSIAANRVSYCLNLKGPSMAVDTACSSSLVAVHLACRSIAAGECSVALAGGVNAIIGPGPYLSFSRMGMLSPDGRCKAFDARANGFVRGEGAGIVVLKTLASALADGDRVYAVILGTAVNQDGRTGGITVPNPEAQEALIREACRRAGVTPRELRYMEAHGTGTPVGDPIEAHALGAALGEGRRADAPCLVGSVKTNIGHLEAGAGVAGLIKTALALKHRLVPPSLHFQTPNPHIDFSRLKLRVAARTEALPRGDVLAGVNSFGFGGTNAHAILGSAPSAAREARGAPAPAPARPLLLVLSARSEEALKAAAASYRVHLAGGRPAPDAVAVCFSAAERRNHHPHRLAVSCASRRKLMAALEAFAAGGSPPEARAGHAPGGGRTGPVFVFSGQGPQWWGMGRELLREEAVFREKIEECDRAMRGFGEWSLLEELFRGESSSRLQETHIAQPAIFAVQMALAALWRSWGVEPAAAVGHSVGEVAAAHVAGALSLADAARVICQRGRCMEKAAGEGRMLAAGLDEREAAEIVRAASGRVSLAAVNSPSSVTLSGEPETLEAVARRLEERQVFARFLQVRYAFHTRQMDPVRDELLASLGDLPVNRPSLPLYSTVTGRPAGEGDFGRDYWWRNVRQTVLFAPAVEAMLDEGHRVFLELSPHPVLSSYVAECLARRSLPGAALPSLRRRESERGVMFGSLGALFVQGCAVDWRAVFPGGRPVALPSYPWRHESFWHEDPAIREARLNPPVHPLLARHLSAAEPSWRTWLDKDTLTWLRDHRLQGHAIFPAAAYLEMALAAGKVLFGDVPLTVEEADFQRAMVLPEGEDALEIQFAFQPADGWFSVASAAQGADEAWVRNAAGRLRPSKDADPPGALDPPRLRERLPEAYPGREAYVLFRRTGLEYGPAFQGIRQVWRGEGEALAAVSLGEGEAGEARLYQAHPALLDACFQVLLAVLPSTVESPLLFMPVTVGSLRMFARLPARVLCHARLAGFSGRSLVGDLLVADEDGRPLMDIRGFTCQAVTKGRAEAEAGSEGWLFEQRWRPAPLPGLTRAPAPARDFPPLPAVVRGIRRQLDRLVDRDKVCAEFRRSRPKLDRLTMAYIVGALKELGWRMRRGESFDPDGLAGRLGVTAAHRRVFRGYLDFLKGAGFFAGSGRRWKVVRAAEPGDPESLWRSVFLRRPGAYPELALLRRCGRRLGAILAGREDALAVIFQDGSLNLADHLYQDAYVFRDFNMMVGAAVETALAGLKAGRVARILEVGGGTGGLTAHVLPRLPREGAQYHFTDLSPLFFSRAESKFIDYPFVSYRPLDLEQPPEEQGFEPRSYDIILASDVLHATGDLRRTMGNLRRLLAPRGYLMFMEIDHTAVWVDMVFGLMAGWWSFTDTELRPDYPLLGGARWKALLAEAGFAQTAEVIHPRGVYDSWHRVIIGREPSEAAAGLPAAAAAGDLAGAWLLLADGAGTAEALADLIEARGGTAVLVRPGKGFRRAPGRHFAVDPSSAADMDHVMQEVSAAGWGPLAGVAHLWGLDLPGGEGTDDGAIGRAESEGCLSIIHLVQSLAASAAPPPKLFLVTRGANAVAAGDAVAVAQAPLWGLGRVIVNEQRKFEARLIDLEPGGGDGEAVLILNEILAGDGEEEVALRGGGRYANRLVSLTPGRAASRPARARRGGWRLEIPHPGVIDQLAFRPLARRRPGPGEVAVEVLAAALNFRDVMKALGIYPTETPEDLLPGDECAGVVTAVGRGVKGLKAGDKVVAVAPGCFASHVVLPEAFVARKPEGLLFEEAVTVPIPYLTAHWALVRLGRIKAGDKVLIQAAAGGVGLAAVQLAHLAGAEVLATAGSPEKRELLAALGVRHVMDSRTLAFADEVMRLTDGRGVDLVLNSLAGEAIPRGMACLAAGGRFLEIGKRDVYANARLGLRPMRRNVSLHVIDLARIIRDEPATVRGILEEILGQLGRGRLHTLPFRVFNASRAVSAFRFMAQARHVGKVVLSMENGDVVPEPPAGALKTSFAPDAAYLVTGGYGGLGSVAAKWMAANGARHLILVGRSGAASPEARRTAAELRRLGARVTVAKADISKARDVARVFREAAGNMPPLKGIIHSSGILEDALLTKIDDAQFRRVTSAKMHGAWNLHRQSLGLPLDFFVMFSSISSVTGNPGQGSYVAANIFLDALANHRRSLGLPGLAVNWGRFLEVGFAVKHKLEEHFDKMGHEGIPPARGMEILGRLMASGAAQAAVFPFDWRLYGRSSPVISRRYAEIVDRTALEGGGEGEPAAEGILSAPAGERRRLMIDHLREQAAKVLRTSPSRLEVERPLNEQGLDSLMAVELMNRIEKQFHASIPPGRFAGGVTIARVADIVLELAAGGSSAEPKPSPAGVAYPECLVPLRAGGALPPLFCFHPTGGMVDIYRHLAAGLPAGRPVVGIQSRRWVGAPEEHRDMASLGRHYADLINERQPEGGCHLFGFSVGGFFAMAAAGALEAMGREVAFLGLAESYLEWAGLRRNLASYLEDQLMDMYGLFARDMRLFPDVPEEEAARRMADLARTIIPALDRPDLGETVIRWAGERGYLKPGQPADVLARFVDLFWEHAKLIEGFRPAPVHGPIHHWRATRSRARGARGKPAWAAFALGPFHDAKLDGVHYDLMYEPGVGRLAARLRAALDGVRPAGGPLPEAQAVAAVGEE